MFSFTEYEREFGGMFASGLIESHVPHAVNQFFLNGGSDLYVVGLKPTIQAMPIVNPPVDYASVDAKVTVRPAPAKASSSKAREPTDLVEMSARVTNLKSSGISADLDTFDLTIAYGRRVETYRGVTITTGRARNAAQVPERRLEPGVDRGGG